MVMSRTIVRIAFALLILSIGLSAQRYTGHDHAVFHRAPQPPPAGAKHASQSSPSGSKASPKSGQGTSSAQTGNHAATGQSHSELDLNQNSAQAPAETAPHF